MKKVVLLSVLCVFSACFCMSQTFDEVKFDSPFIFYLDGNVSVDVHVYKCKAENTYVFKVCGKIQDCKNGFKDFKDKERIIDTLKSYFAACSGWDYDKARILLESANFKKQADTLVKKLEEKTVAADKKKELIGKNEIKFLGAAFVNSNLVKGDDPSGFAQSYFRLSMPLGRGKGIDDNADCVKRTQLFRNALFQLTLANADKLPVYYDQDNLRYANRMDLLQYAYLNVNVTLNFISFIVPSSKRSGDYAHLYFDGFATLLATNVTDTLTKDPLPVYSNVYGLNLKFVSTNWSLADTRIAVEFGLQAFWIYGVSNSVNPDLNFQAKRTSEYNTLQNPGKNLTVDITPNYRVETMITLNTSKEKENASNVFLRYAYYTNFAKRSGPLFFNNYMQFQLGYALDILKLFPAEKKESKDK